MKLLREPLPDLSRIASSNAVRQGVRAQRLPQEFPRVNPHIRLGVERLDKRPQHMVTA